MGRKSVVKSFKMIDQGDISGNVTSAITNVINLDIASIAISWSGTSPIGSITVQARNGEQEAFRDIDIGTINVSGNTGNHDLIFTELPFTDLQVTYTATSGTGTLDAVLTSKVTGA